MIGNDPKNISESIPEDYFILHRVLHDAFDQAATGKGKERHANDDAFEDQICCYLLRHIGIGGAIFQVCKKAIEAQRLPYPANVIELRGAINYAASAIIECERLAMESEQSKQGKIKPFGGCANLSSVKVAGGLVTYPEGSMGLSCNNAAIEFEEQN